MAKEKNNPVGNYFWQKVIGGIGTVITTVICVNYTRFSHRKERKEQLKDREKSYDLRNQKAVELKKMIQAIDKNPVNPDVKIKEPKSFSIMTSRPMAEESGWLIPGYARKGQISCCVAGADSGKTVLVIDSALAVARGERPSFLSKTSPVADKMDVVVYRLEERAGEMRDRYGDGSMFPSNFGWITRADMDSPTFEGLLADITKRAKGFKRDTAVFVDPLSKLANWDIAKFLTAMEAVQEECAERGVIVSVFFTAHTEETKPWKPLTPDMIRGGDTTIQQVGALFAIRRERGGNGYRFLQVLKVPKGEVEKDSVDVICFEGRDEAKPGSYTHLVHHCVKAEKEALPLRTKPAVEKEEQPAEKPKKAGKLAGKEEEIRAMKAEGKKVSEIAVFFKVSHQAIYDILKKS